MYADYYLLSACTKIEENIPFTFTASLIKWVFGAGHRRKIQIRTQLQHIGYKACNPLCRCQRFTLALMLLSSYTSEKSDHALLDFVSVGTGFTLPVGVFCTSYKT